MVQLGRAHLFLEFLLDEDPAQDIVGAHEHVVVVEQDVVDADHAIAPQLGIAHKGRPAPQRQVHRVVHVVVEVRAGGHDPVHEASLDQGNYGGAAQTRRSQRSCQAHAHRDPVVGQHFFRKQAAAFAQAAGVVGEKGCVDEIRQALLARDRLGQNALAPQVHLLTLGKLVRVLADELLGQNDLAHFGDSFPRSSPAREGWADFGQKALRLQDRRSFTWEP